jgi:hypothetical protein
MKTQQKTKPSRKQIFAYSFVALCFVLTAVAGRMLVYDEQVEDGLSEKELQVLIDEQNLAQINNLDGQIRDLEQIDKELTDINSANNNDSKARLIVADESLDFDEKLRAVGALFSSCKQRQDTDCMSTLIGFMEASAQDSLNIWMYVDVARISKEQSNLEVSRENYQKAKSFADARGGEQYINEVNSSSDVELSYGELVDGSS